MDDRAGKSEALDLSVMIPCRDNVRTIGRVLESVRGLCSQLVVIDSGSTDGTLELVEACREWCEVVLVQTHWRGFVRTKSMGLEACSRKYALWLDSDEPVSSEMGESVRRLLQEEGGDGVDAAKVQRVVEYKGKLLMHSWQPEWRLRLVMMDLVRDGRARFAGIDPHDYLEVEDGTKVRSLDGVLVHDSFETFSEHLGNQLRLSRVSAESLHAMGKRGSVWKIVSSPVGAFLKQVVVKGCWRDGYAGWLAASTSAAGALMKHVVLYELGRGNIEPRAHSYIERIKSSQINRVGNGGDGIYFNHKCPTCQKYGMMIAVVLVDGAVVAQCDECEVRYSNPSDIGDRDAGTRVFDHDEIHHAAVWDEIVQFGWDKSCEWERLENVGISDYFRI